MKPRCEPTLRETLTLFCEREFARKDERRIGIAFGLARCQHSRERTVGLAHARWSK